MGGQSFDVEPADLRGAAPSFSTAASGLEQALAELNSTLEGLGDYLGSDDQGMKFKSGYNPKSSEAKRSIQNIATGLKHIDSALVASAGQYERDDSEASDGMNRQVR